MINIKELTIEDGGRWVEYINGTGEKERGRIKSWNDSFIFVVYKCNEEWLRYRDFTGVATSPQDLTFVCHIKDESYLHGAESVCPIDSCQQCFDIDNI